jgi:hypothetical protein
MSILITKGRANKDKALIFIKQKFLFSSQGDCPEMVHHRYSITRGGWGGEVNPFISITLSKPLMSSGSWLTLLNCEIFYLLAVNYDPATTDLIFIRVNIYPGPGEGGS